MNRPSIDKEETAADEDVLLEEAIKLAAAEHKELERKNCKHGDIEVSLLTLYEAEIFIYFIPTFVASYHAAQDRGVKAHVLRLEAGYDETKERFLHIWEDSLPK